MKFKLRTIIKKIKFIRIIKYDNLFNNTINK